MLIEKQSSTAWGGCERESNEAVENGVHTWAKSQRKKKHTHTPSPERKKNNKEEKKLKSAIKWRKQKGKKN